MYSILSHSSLTLQSEDSLCELILNRLNPDSNFFALLHFVRFEYLSIELFSTVLDVIQSSFELFDFQLWSALRPRLLLSPNATTRNSRLVSSHIIECPLLTGFPFHGIIAYLTEKCHGNVHDCDLVTITSNRTRNDQHDPKNVADFESERGFWSDNRPNQWLAYDFGRRRVCLTHYSLCSHNSRSDAHPRNWVLEGSTDGSVWVELDRRANNGQLNGAQLTATFAIGGGGGGDWQMGEQWQIVRLRSIGKSYLGCDYLGFSAFEVFGTLVEPDGRDQYLLKRKS
jgi:hypothetical protein